MAVLAVAEFMRPYSKGFRRLEKEKRKASEWNDRAVLRAQHMGGAQGQTVNAQKAKAASDAASGALDKASIRIMVEYHRQFEGWQFSSLPEMNDAIMAKGGGTGEKIEALEESLAKEKHKAAGRIKLPVAIMGLLALGFCAIAGLFGAAGLAVLAGASVALAVAGIAADALFSRREAALSTWQKSAARVRGLVQDGNGDDAMNELVAEKALENATPEERERAAGGLLFPGQEN